MRKVTTIFFVFTFLIMTDCETERVIFKGPYFVRFTEASQTEKESYSKPISIEVHNAGPALEEDIIITYKISGNAREGIDYAILSDRQKITIKKGEYFANIQLQLINNANNILRSQNIVFTLQNVSGGNLQIGQGESAIGKSFTFTINDDCILGGTYVGKQGSTTLEDLSVISADCETYTLSNWNIGIFTTTTEMDLKFIDNGETLTIPQQEEENLPADKATIQGIGTVDPYTREINLKITLIDFDSARYDILLIPD